MSNPTGANKRACDACHRRKVRCNGQNPCQNCLQASLTCAFDKPPQKKGPKGSRAKVISELKKTEESKVGSSLLGGSGALTSPHSSTPRPVEPLPSDLVDTCIAQFFDKMYNTVPILHRNWIDQKKMEALASPDAYESYCVVASVCVYMLVHAGVEVPPASNPRAPSSSPMAPLSQMMRQHPVAQAQRLVEDIKRVRLYTEFQENPTTATIITSFFLSASHFGCQKYNVAWYYLQEAITFAKIMRIHDEKSYQLRPPTALDAINRRLFWLLFVSERAQALHKHRDISFHETLDFPKPHPDPSEDLGLVGLTYLYSLFRIVDSKVSEMWNNLRSENPTNWPENTAAWLAQLQRQVTNAVPVNLKCTQIQEADIKFTQQWLRTVIWQLSTARGCLSSNASDPSMTLRYPIEIAQDLVAVTSRLPFEAMDVHGIGIVEKLFDIAYVLVDVIHVLQVEQGAFAANPRDSLAHFLTLVTSLRHGETPYVQLLRAKIRETLPDMAASLGLPLVTPASSGGSGRSPSGSGASPYAPAGGSGRSPSGSVVSPYAPAGGPGRSPTGSGASPYAPTLSRIDSSHSSTSSSYGGVVGLSPIAPATPRFPGLAARPLGQGQGSADPSMGTIGGRGIASLTVDTSSDAMETDQRPYQGYGAGPGYRPQ